MDLDVPGHPQPGSQPHETTCGRTVFSGALPTHATTTITVPHASQLNFRGIQEAPRLPEGLTASMFPLASSQTWFDKQTPLARLSGNDQNTEAKTQDLSASKWMQVAYILAPRLKSLDQDLSSLFVRLHRHLQASASHFPSTYWTKLRKPSCQYQTVCQHLAQNILIVNIILSTHF